MAAPSVQLMATPPWRVAMIPTVPDVPELQRSAASQVKQLVEALILGAQVSSRFMPVSWLASIHMFSRPLVHSAEVLNKRVVDSFRAT